MTSIVVIGAGVIGLSTGIRLAEHGHTVRIITAETPTATTSAAATGMVGLAFAEPMDKVPGWEASTLTELGAIRPDPAAGVRYQRCLLGSRHDSSLPPGIESWPSYTPANSGDLPDGFQHGFWLEMTVIDMARYLPYLVDRFAAAGGAIEIGRVASFDDLAAEPVVVNCAGVGARALTGDETLTAEWGMHVVLENPGVDHCFMEGPPGQAEWVAWMPHGQQLLIGGAIDPGRSDSEPDIETGERMLAAAAKANPQLASARVVGHNSGLRPARPVIRVEEEQLASDRRLIHNYGHGGLGVTLSWGCADDVTAMLARNRST
jgi:D-amino-acid oxidase